MMIFMWITIGTLLSFNYPNLGGAVLGSLTGIFIILGCKRVGERIATKLWNFFMLAGDEEV